MNNREKMAVAIAGVAGAAIIAVGVASYHSPWTELARVQEALASRDPARLEAALNWQSVRDENIRRMAGTALAASGLGGSDERANELVLAIQGEVDRAVTPAKLIESLGAKKISADSLVIRGAYLSMGTYVFAIEDPASKGAISVRMRRQGPMSWRIDDATILDTSALRARQEQAAAAAASPAKRPAAADQPASQGVVELH